MTKMKKRGQVFWLRCWLLIYRGRSLQFSFSLSFFFFFSCKLDQILECIIYTDLHEARLKNVFLFELKKNWRKCFSRSISTGAPTAEQTAKRNHVCMFIYMHHTQIKTALNQGAQLRWKYTICWNKIVFYESMNAMVGKTLGEKPGHYHAMDDRNVRCKQSRNAPRWHWWMLSSSFILLRYVSVIHEVVWKILFRFKKSFWERVKTEDADFPFEKMSLPLLAESYKSDK